MPRSLRDCRRSPLQRLSRREEAPKENLSSVGLKSSDRRRREGGGEIFLEKSLSSSFSSTSYELSVRSWAKRSLRCCHREIRSDNLLIVLNLLFPWIISPIMASLRSQKVHRNSLFGKLFYKTTFSFFLFYKFSYSTLFLQIIVLDFL